MAHHNPSTTQRRNLDPSNSMDLSARNNPKCAVPASSYNPATHFSKMGIGRKSSRARSPPPCGRTDPHPDSLSNLQGVKKSLSKSAIFEGSNLKHKPFFIQSCAQSVRETKGAGLGKLGGDLVKPVARLGRSKSLCDAQLQLANFLVINGVKVFSSDMPPLMQIQAVGSARKTCDSLEKFSSKALASSLKKEFDEAYGPAWHCIVGTSFGSFVTHSVGGFLYFSMDQKLHILLFKTSVQRAA